MYKRQSDYHEGFDFASMIASLDMEWVDPVQDAAPLRATENDPLPADIDEVVRGAADVYVVAIQDWWQRHRQA